MSRKMKVIKTVENKLLKRKELEVEILEKEASLTRYDIKTQIAKSLQIDVNLVVVEKVNTHFGSRDVIVKAYAYDDEATLKSLTREHIVKRNAAPKKEEAEE